MMATVTLHAIERYQERIEHVSHDEAERRLFLHAQAVDLAASIGCESVRLGNGMRLVLKGSAIVSVYPRVKKDPGRWRPRCLRRTN